MYVCMCGVGMYAYLLYVKYVYMELCMYVTMYVRAYTVQKTIHTRMHNLVHKTYRLGIYTILYYNQLL